MVEDNSGWRPFIPDSLSGIKELVLDCETTGLKWWAGDKPVGWAIAAPDGRRWYLPIRHKGGNNLDPDKVHEFLRRELRDKLLIGANIRFDAHMAKSDGIDLEEQGCRLTDVQHYAALLDDHRREFSLDVLGQEFLGQKKLRRVQGVDIDPDRIWEYPSGIIAPYAFQDLDLTWGLRRTFMPMLDAEDLQRVRQLEDDLIWAVVEMERNGCPLDVELLERWINQTEQKVIWYTQEIRKLTGLSIDPNKTADMERLFNHLHLPVTHYTEKGTASFTDEVLELSPHPVVKLARQARKILSLRSKYFLKYKKTLRDDGILRYALHQLRQDEGGTVSGRFASAALDGEGGNIQQVPEVEKQIKASGPEFVVRKLIVPSKGKKTLSADAKQVEYRVFADYANSPRLNKAYADDPESDFHNVVWDMVRPYRDDLLRKQVKNVNFARMFGGGDEKIADMLGLSLKEAKEFVAVYDRAFPEVRALMSVCMSKAKSRGYVRTKLGRRVRFPNGQRLHKALNGVVQGTATGDLMKWKIIELHRARKRTGFVMRATIHDEVLGDTSGPECTAAVAEILNSQTFPGLHIPILWDVKTGDNWAEC